MERNAVVKEEVLGLIAGGNPWTKAVGQGQSKWRVGTKVIHMRYATSPKANGLSFAYNINPNTLRADYEVWICGASFIYYLIPMFEIRSMYDHPEAYVDHHHPELRVAEVNTHTHMVLYGRGGLTTDFSRYYLATLQP